MCTVADLGLLLPPNPYDPPQRTSPPVASGMERGFPRRSAIAASVGTSRSAACQRASSNLKTESSALGDVQPLQGREQFLVNDACPKSEHHPSQCVESLLLREPTIRARLQKISCVTRAMLVSPKDDEAVRNEITNAVQRR